MENMQYQYAGFFSTATVTAFHFQDIVIAIVLGFFGAAGGYLFKCILDIIRKRK